MADGTAEFIDAREVAPAAANETMFVGEGWAAGDSGSWALQGPNSVGKRVDLNCVVCLQLISI